MTLPVVGDVIADKYDLVRTLGVGGMGVVFEANHRKLDQRVAIKVLNPKQDKLAEAIVRFERESRAVARLEGVHIAKVVDVDSLPSGLPYIVLEYLAGRDLGAELAEVGPLPMDVAVDYVMQAATALAGAHAAGVIHRDIKPANLFLCDVPVAGRKLVKLLDFGVAKIVGETTDKLTGIDGCIGTPAYMAPEQLRAEGAVDGRADVWSLGVVLFELLTGTTPFTGSLVNIIAGIAADTVPDPRKIRPAIPDALAAVVLRMLAKEPDERIATMGEVVDALAPFGPVERVSSALAAIPSPMGRIGDILIENAIVTPSQLDAALAHQRASGKRLGRALVDLGYVGAPDLIVALAKQESAVTSLAPPPHRPEPKPAPAVEQAAAPAPVVAKPSPRRRGLLAWALVVAIGVLGTVALGSASSDPPAHGSVNAP